MTKKITPSERARYRATARAIVREGRLRLGLTQLQMGNLVDLSQGEISRIETGTVEPAIWLIMHLLHIYPDLLSAAATIDVENVRTAVRQRVETMDETALRTVLMLARVARRPRRDL